MPRPLTPCGSGSCVSTQAARTDPLRRIEPLAFALPPEVAIRAVLAALGRLPRVRVLERDLRSVHAVGRSAILRVPLDLEVRIHGEVGSGHVHLRVSTPLALRRRARSRTRAAEILELIERELRRVA
jgi:uncharacterized protein (DUF1499 family)